MITNVIIGKAGCQAVFRQGHGFMDSTIFGALKMSMNKFLSGFSILVIILFCLSVFGWMIKHITIGDRDFGNSVNNGLNSFVSFLDLFEESVEEVQKLPETFVPTPQDFQAINNLKSDILAVVTYSNESKGRTVEVRNLKNDEVFHRWKLPAPFQEHDRIMDPLVMKDKSLCYSINGVTGLMVIDSAGNEIWKQDSIAHHHAINLDSAGNIWACSYTKEYGEFIIYKGKYTLGGREFVYIDNTISKLDAATGALLFHRSLTDILQANGLENLLLKSNKGDDPLHLNDVQPALKTTPYYREGDLFISLRNVSAILHYRPSSDKVVRVLEGMFYSQHDVDFLNDSVIYFFNNNAHTLWLNRASDYRVAEKRLDAGNFYSNIMAYDLKNDRYFYLSDQAFKENHIYTFTEGMSEVLSNGQIFVEEQNSGILWVLDGDEVVYKNVLDSHHEGHHHLLNWTRIMHDHPW